ncbi:MAG: hypothetical protein AB7F19_02530 [Candidatus Babeliales bacterium]
MKFICAVLQDVFIISLGTLLFCILIGISMYAKKKYTWLFIPFFIGLFFAYHAYFLLDKIHIGMNVDGIYAWQSGNEYLFIPWNGITNISQRYIKRYKRRGYYRIEIDYVNAELLQVLSSSTYVAPGKDVDFTILYSEPGFGGRIEFAHTSCDIHKLENAIRKFRARYSGAPAIQEADRVAYANKKVVFL